MPSDTHEDLRPLLPVDNTLNALDAVQAAMTRIVEEKRMARRRMVRDHLALGEALSREELLTLKHRIPSLR